MKRGRYDPIDLAYAVIRTSMSKVVLEGRDSGALRAI